MVLGVRSLPHGPRPQLDTLADGSLEVQPALCELSIEVRSVLLDQLQPGISLRSTDGDREEQKIGVELSRKDLPDGFLPVDRLEIIVICSVTGGTGEPAEQPMSPRLRHLVVVHHPSLTRGRLLLEHSLTVEEADPRQAVAVGEDQLEGLSDGERISEVGEE